MYETLDSHDSDDLLKSTLLSSTLLEGAKSQTVTFNINNIGPEVSIYPLTLDFLPCYLNGTATKKIILTNSGGKKAVINASILGDPAFSLQNSHIEIDSGKPSYILVRFQPFQVSDSFASITISGDANVTIPVSGKCLKSPIELPDQDDTCWYFNPSPNTKKIPITNTDLSKSFHLIITSNSPGFIVKTPILIISPSSTINIKVRYEPEQSRSLNPQITVVSEEASVKISRKLLFNNVKSTIIFDFQKISVNTVATRDFTLETRAIPKDSLKSPFGFSITQNKVIFSFSPKRSGNFKALVPMDSVDVLLKGSAMIFPLVFDEKTNRLLNTTKDTFYVSLESRTIGITLNPPVVEVLGHKSSLIKFIRNMEVRGNVDVDFDCRLILPDCETVVMQFHGISEAAPVTDAQSQTNEIKSRNGKTNYENNSITKNETSDNSPKKRQKSEIKTSQKIIKPRSNQASKKKKPITQKPEIHPSILTFFDNQEITISITGCYEFELEGPTWLKFPSQISVNEPFNVKCPRLPSKAHSSDITITSQGNSVSIPIIAYSGSSALECPKNTPLTAVDGAFECKVKVRNEGNRSAFALMAATDNCVGVSVSPPGAVIAAGTSTTFRFRAEGEQIDDIEVVMYWGDDIIREIREVHYGDLFGQIAPSSEFQSIKSVVENLDRHLVSKLFKKSIQEQHFILKTPVKAGGLAVTPHRIRIVPGFPSRLSLLNMSPASVRYHVFCPHHLSVIPEEGIVPRYGEFPLQVTASAKASKPAEIEIRTSSGIITVPVEILRADNEKIPEEAFSLDNEIIDFGFVEVCSKMAMNVSINRQGYNNIDVILVSKNRNFHTTKIFTYPRTVRAGQNGSFVVEFRPSAEMKYEEIVEVSYKDFKKNILIMGRGVKARCVRAECDIIDFPSTKSGEKKVCRIKISNRSEKSCRVVASVTYPFSVEVSSFGVDSGSYVLFPVTFNPLTAGHFLSTLRFAPDAGKPFSVEVRGECVDDPI